MLKLGDAGSTGVAPSPSTRPIPLRSSPHSGTIVGFGQTEGISNDYGIKRGGQVQTAICPPGLPAGATDSDVVCWNFLDPHRSAGQRFQYLQRRFRRTALHRLRQRRGRRRRHLGRHSGRLPPEDDSYDANVYTHRAFILGELGGDSTTACGGLAPVEDAQTTVTDIDGYARTGRIRRTLHVTVPAGANALRVALNGEDNGLFDIDLYVKQGTGASSTSFDCAANGLSVFGACTFDLPAGRHVVDRRRARRRIGRDIRSPRTVFGGGAPIVRQRRARVQRGVRWGDAGQCPGQCADRLHVRAAVFCQ